MRERGTYGVLVGKPEVRDCLKDPGVDGMIILRCFIRMYGKRARTGLICLRVDRGGGLLQRR
jgi:hypothetical protein